MQEPDRKSTSMNYTPTDIYTLPLHDALPICHFPPRPLHLLGAPHVLVPPTNTPASTPPTPCNARTRSEEHKYELHSHRYLHSSPTRRTSDLSFSSSPSAPTGRSARFSPPKKHPRFHPSYPMQCKN